jgi:hypothetical protein
MAACKNCQVKLISRKGVMESGDALEENDPEQNPILPFVAVPQTDLGIDAGSCFNLNPLAFQKIP